MSAIKTKQQNPALSDSVQADAKLTHVETVLVNGQALENWPQDLFIPPDALEVFLETFSGPLDLLLYLIRKQNLDILDIPVARITRQYMEYVNMMRKLRLDLVAEYLVMAAMLAEIKSRLLLPRPATEEDADGEDPRAALVRRLQEYERFSQAGMEINKIPRVERELYPVTVDFEEVAPLKVVSQASLNDLVVAFRNVLERMDANKPLAFGVEKLTVREKMTHILDKIRVIQLIRFEDLFDQQEGKHGLVVSFMAILELVRDDMLVVMQNGAFTPIYLKSVAKNADE